jgi:site-specific recombinase XerD
VQFLDRQLEGSDPQRPPGRPYGAKAAVQAPHLTLRHAHFAYVRYALNGLPLRQAWLRCLAFGGGVDDERHFHRRLREIASLIRAAAASRGLTAMAETALQGLQLRRRRAGQAAAPAAAPPGSEARAIGAALQPAVGATRSAAPGSHIRSPAAAAAALPTLDDWIAQRCAELGIGDDFQSEAEWQAEYEEAVGLDQAARAGAQPGTVARSALAMPLDQAALGVEGDETASAGALARAAALREQLAALASLTTLLAVAPALADGLDTWLAPTLHASLHGAGISTVRDLADFVDQHGHRWWRRVPGVGADRAQRLLAWLAPLVEQLGRPLAPAALHPAHHLVLARAAQLAPLDPLRQLRYGIVPLQRLAVPPELSGRRGVFRAGGPNTLGAGDDLAALQAWLARHATSPQTYRTYFHAVELFYLWCVWERRIALSSLVEGDLKALCAFVAAPPPHWVQPRAVSRDSADWRPLRGPMTERSQRLLFTAVKALFSGLLEAGYLTANAAKGLRLHWQQPTARLGVRRALSGEQWRWIVAMLAEQPPTAQRRRLRLVLELASTTGLRRAEMAGARLGHLRQEWLEGRAAPPTWFLSVTGKGRRQRDVVIAPHVKDLIDQHQMDLLAGETAARTAAAATPATPVAPGRPAAPVAPLPPGDPRRPLIGALRPPPARWALGPQGQPVQVVQPANEVGALEASALYQSLRRLFARAAQRAHLAHPPLDADELRLASTHWLRHTFANMALEQGVSLTVVRDMLGHADLATTSIYLRSEQRTMAREMAKLHKPMHALAK